LRRKWGAVIQKSCVFIKGVGAQVTSASQALPKRPCQGWPLDIETTTRRAVKRIWAPIFNSRRRMMLS